MAPRRLNFPLPQGCLFAGQWPAKLPVLLSSPHSGLHYSKTFERFSLLAPKDLTALGDGPIHQLLAPCQALGVPLVHARYARAVVDMNRACTECLPFLFEKHQPRQIELTERSRAGLGVIPTRIGMQAIYDRALPADELNWRLHDLHEPYHQLVETLHSEMHETFGRALLLDVHSMPDSVARSNGRKVDVVIGTCHGQSAPAQLIDAVQSFLSGLTLRVAIDNPYSGGYVTQRHGRPQSGKPALQLELRRSLFLNKNKQLSMNAQRIGQHLADLVAHIAQILLDDPAHRKIDAA